MPEDRRTEMRKDFEALLDRWEAAEAEKRGSTALYTVIGQKADFVMVHLRPTLQDL